MAKSFYPNLSSIVTVDQMPEQLQFIENGLQSALDKIYYKNLQLVKSQNGSNAFLDLTLVTNEPIQINLTDDGLALVLNPGGAGETLIPLQLTFAWPILALINGFKLSDFAEIPDKFKELFEDSINLSVVDMMQVIVKTFEGNDTPTAFNSFVDKINASYSLTGINEVPYPANGSPLRMSQEIIAAIEGNIVITDTVREVMSDVFILSNDITTFRNNLDRLSVAVTGKTIGDFIKELITPRIDASLDLSIGLAFPRTYLTPLQSVGGDPIPEPELSILIFSAGTLKFSTQGGVGFDEDMSVSLNHPSMIGNTGMGIEITNVKLDLSRTTNILEADLDGRSTDFMGVYIEKIGITLPEKWFKNQTPGSTAEIFGKNLLIGTGGISGTLGLEAVGGNDILWAEIGENDGFKVGFESFDISFKQNKVISSNIVGAMEIKKFVYPQSSPYAGQPVKIGIEGHIHDNGDFNLTASAAPPYPIELKDVFTYHIASLEFGKQEDLFYIGTSGSIEFQGFLKDTLKLGPIDLDRLRIYSDGSFELEGGSINLLEPIVLALGPVEITVSAIHFGSHQKEVGGVMRKFNYFGFDGGISVDPLGIEIRGDGVKFYYCSDNISEITPSIEKPKPYLHIQTLYLDLTIPASSPAVIFNGWLSIPEPGASKEYAGGIKLQIPQAKISGSADMKLMPKYPAFIIDVSVDLPAPIAIGPVGIYGFRGLIGYRYVAEKEAVGLVSGVDSWYDYYKHPPRGIHVTKFNGPDKTKFAGTPFSLGIGASLGTSFDNGTVVNIRAMILLSIPSLFMIDGRAAILSARLGLEDSGEPPFFAFIAIGDNSLEFGIGADFKMPTKTGKTLTLYADIQAGFFFNDSSKWYVNVGTKTNPITARVLTLVTITSYLMMSAKGIEAGARGEFDFKREYGPIKVHAWAYIEVGGKISFEKPQFGAYLAAGVGADIDIKIVSLYASFDILFGVEAPKPFLIYGEFHYCVKITIAWVFKFKFCGNLTVMWEFDQNVDRSPVNPLINPDNAGNIPNLVKGVNMLSNETFELAYLGASLPGSPTTAILNTIIPLDTYVDIKTEKGFIPNAIGNVIGGINNPPERYTEMVPPEKIIHGKEVRQVKHQYSIESLSVKSWNPTTSSWQDYNPYQALNPSDASLSTYKIGQFQKSGNQYNTVRLLATTPFSYTEQGEPGWFIPEQYGITDASLFCQGEYLTPECANFLEKPLTTKYYCYNQNQLFYSNEAAFLLLNRQDGDFAQVVNDSNVFGFNQSLSFLNSNKLQIRLPEPSVEVNLKLTTYGTGVRIKYYASLIDDTTLVVQYGNPDSSASNPSEPYEVTVNKVDLNVPVTYSHPEWMAVTRIEVEPIFPNQQQIDDLIEQIAVIQNTNNQIELGLMEGQVQSTEELEAILIRLTSIGCSIVQGTGYFVNAYIDKEAPLSFHYAEEFKEGNESYIYAVGYKKEFPVMLKTNLDGSIVWQYELSLELQKRGIRFRKIVQLERDRKNGYIISGYNGTNTVLLGIDTAGTVLWIKEVGLKDEDIHSILLASFDKIHAYFIYSDKNGFDGIRTPTVLKIDQGGNIVMQRALVADRFANIGVVVNAAKTYEKGIVIAGRGFDKDSESIIYDLDDNLNTILFRHVEYPNLTIQDLLVVASDNYIISAYSSNHNAVIVSHVVGTGSSVCSVIPSSSNASSMLTFASGGVLIYIDYPGHGFVHKMNAGMDIEWSKQFIDDKDAIGLRSATFSPSSKHVVITTESNDYLLRSDEALETCITVPRTFEKPKVDKLNVQDVNVKIVESKIELRQIGAKPTPIDVKIDQRCGSKGETENKCSSLLHEVCWLSLENYEYNMLIPGQAAIEADTLATINGITQQIQPIWRPDTSYAVSFSLKDEVDNGTSSPGTYSYAYGFTTGGPVGFFHKNNKATYGDIDLGGGLTLEDANGIVRDGSGNIVPPNPLNPITPHPEKYPLTSLTRYIDYERSYPNADGNLLSSKPLFYDDETTQIDLFFSKAYATHFFHNWDPYNGQVAANGRIKIVIKDPREDISIVNPPYLDYDPADTVYTNLPQTIESWQDDPNPLLPFVFQQYANLIEANDCVPFGGDAIAPPSQSLEVKMKHLKPLKLYTAVVNNLYDLDKNGTFDALTETTEVHKFTFQTSRYPGFKKQVNSFILNSPNILTVDHKADGLVAAYSLVNIQASFDTIVGTPNPVGDVLIPTYPNPYDRVVEGVLGLAPFALPTEKPEFKFIKDSNNADAVIGVIVLSPTPMNSQRVPYEEVLELIQGLDYNGNLNADYKIALNADYTQAIVMHTSLGFAGSLLSFKFQHPTTADAVFGISKGLTALEIAAAYDTITNNPNPLGDDLEINYQHKFDRIFEGLWGFTPLDKAATTEFNVIRNSSDGDNIVAVIIRNPEPFNNPRIPLNIIQDTVQVLNNIGEEDLNYKKVFSKDYSQVLIMHNSMEIVNNLDLKFTYKVWDGSNYIIPSIPDYTSDSIGTIVISNLDIQSVI